MLSIIQFIVVFGLCIKELVRFLNGHLFTVFWTVYWLSLYKGFDGFLHLISAVLEDIFIGFCVCLALQKQGFQSLNIYLRNMSKYKDQTRILGTKTNLVKKLFKVGVNPWLPEKGRRLFQYYWIPITELLGPLCLHNSGEEGRSAGWDTCT